MENKETWESIGLGRNERGSQAAKIENISGDKNSS